jgi:hypothetical protein
VDSITQFAKGEQSCFADFEEGRRVFEWPVETR